MATVDEMRHLPPPRTDRPPAVAAQPRETKGRMAKVATTAAPIGSLLTECYSSVVLERPLEITVRTAQLFAANLQGISGGSIFCNSWLENT